MCFTATIQKSTDPQLERGLIACCPERVTVPCFREYSQGVIYSYTVDTVQCTQVDGVIRIEDATVLQKVEKVIAHGKAPSEYISPEPSYPYVVDCSSCDAAAMIKATQHQHQPCYTYIYMNIFTFLIRTHPGGIATPFTCFHQ